MSSVHSSGAVDTEALRAALERSDAEAITNLFADDAELQVLDHLHPPSRPRIYRGKAAIAGYWRDVCGRRMTHTVERIIHDGSIMAYSEACRHPDGARLQCLAFLDLVNGKIARQIGVQTWDDQALSANVDKLGSVSAPLMEGRE